jgi:hypothetical protein
MFDGNKDCSICRKELGENERNFGVSLMGYTYVFCSACFKGKREQVRGMLHDEANSSRRP